MRTVTYLQTSAIETQSVITLDASFLCTFVVFCSEVVCIYHHEAYNIRYYYVQRSAGQQI